MSDKIVQLVNPTDSTEKQYPITSMGAVFNSSGVSVDLILNEVTEDVSDIKVVVPVEATSSNKLADKNYTDTKASTAEQNAKNYADSLKAWDVWS